MCGYIDDDFRLHCDSETAHAMHNKIKRSPRPAEQSTMKNNATNRLI
jgi:hypothetical protein